MVPADGRRSAARLGPELVRSACFRRLACTTAADRRAGTASRGSGGPGHSRTTRRNPGLIPRLARAISPARRSSRVLDECLHGKRQSLDPLQLERKYLFERLWSDRRHDLKGRNCPESADRVDRPEAVGLKLDDVDAALRVALASGGNSSTVSRNNDASLECGPPWDSSALSSHRTSAEIGSTQDGRAAFPAGSPPGLGRFQVRDRICVQARQCQSKGPVPQPPCLFRLPRNQPLCIQECSGFVCLMSRVPLKLAEQAQERIAATEPRSAPATHRQNV